jgi:cystathionine beta-lyase
MVDSVYGPARALCDKTLARFGIETTYYDPLVGAGIADLMRLNTRLVYLESPGSLTFEVQDVPAIVTAAHAKGALVSWTTPGRRAAFQTARPWHRYRHPRRHEIHRRHLTRCSAIVVRDSDLYRTIKLAAHGMGLLRRADDCYLALRGLRTLGVRLRRHGAGWRWRAGCRGGPRSRACCIRACRSILATSCGAAILPAPPASSASC